MKLPDYWLQSPENSIDQSTQTAFDQLYFRAVERNDGSTIDYTLAAPRWHFLNYLVEKHDIVFHGSGNRDIAMLEPRKADDSSAFGNQEAVYAAADGIWAMFFAVVDRDKYEMSVNNACIQIVEDGKTFYLFSISQDVLQEQPWRRGVVYLLPSQTFVEQPEVQFGDMSIRVKQHASLVPVKPIAKIEIAPEDFPFLAQILGHDDARGEAYAVAMNTGGPWPT